MDDLRVHAKGKSFTDFSGNLNSIDFDTSGELCVAGSDDESIRVYSARAGKELNKIYSKKYGVDLVRCCRDKDFVIYASKNGWDHTLRFLSIKTNKYVRYYRGHRDRVTTLSTSKHSELILSGSLDCTLRLWDLRSANCQGQVHCAGRLAAAFEPQACAFAVAGGGNAVHLFDVRKYDGGPFATFIIPAPQHEPLEWTGIEFNAAGTHLVATAAPQRAAYVLDAFEGRVVRSIVDDDLYCNATFTPDGAHVLCGLGDGGVGVWRAPCGGGNADDDNDATAVHANERSEREQTFKGGGRLPVRVLKYNPRIEMLAVGTNSLSFWITS